MAKQEETFTKIPNAILDNSSLNVYERVILIHIARQTIGYNKKSDGISLSQFVKATGISKAKVIRTVEGLKGKKLIQVVKQTSSNNGKSFNRYSLILVSHRDKLVSDRDNPSISQRQELVSDRDIQKKIEQKKIDKRRERDVRDNIFFSLSDHERKREVNSFSEYISIGTSNQDAYKVKIKKQIAKEHPETLEAFQEWYFTKTCKELTTKYHGRSIDGYQIESVYPHSYTERYVDSTHYEIEYFYYVQAKNAKGQIEVWGANSSKDMDLLLMDMVEGGGDS